MPVTGLIASPTQFRSPEARVVVSPGEYSSGTLQTFGDARKSHR